jgi:hypothetical protein
MPDTLLACAVCGLNGTQENSVAYAAMSWMLSGLPLVMIGGLVAWVYRRATARDAEPSDPPGPATRS